MYMLYRKKLIKHFVNKTHGKRRVRYWRKVAALRNPTKPVLAGYFLSHIGNPGLKFGPKLQSLRLTV